MQYFVLAITTFNRLDYLKECITSWNNTKSPQYKWTLIIADDDSTDGTLKYIDNLKIEQVDILIIKNHRIGVHQQTNTIFKQLESIDFDCCFVVDDDLTFLKNAWDECYYQSAIETGNHHLVFCDETWTKTQLLKEAKTTNKLIGKVPMLQVNGIFYTITPEILRKVGYMDVASFGYRGMGHVDYTMRCARAGFTNTETPWDVKRSNEYLSAVKNEYKSVLPSTAIGAYDSFYRKEKEEIILKENRIHISYQAINENLFLEFKAQLIHALTAKVEGFESEKQELITWYKQEIDKTKEWYAKEYQHLPNWYLKLAKVFKLFIKK